MDRNVHVPTWVKSMKKVELHAHLSGSIQSNALRTLLRKQGKEHINERAKHLSDIDGGRTLKQCFDLFSIIHDLIQDRPTLFEVCTQVLRDFQDDNVVYLELRTTPRRTKYMTENEYLATVLNAIHDFHQDSGNYLQCRLLISLSRHLPVIDAKTTIHLVEQLLSSNSQSQSQSQWAEAAWARQLIVGVELSGNPTKGKWADFEPVLMHVRSSLHLAVSLHFAEVPNEDECLHMLRFQPDRVGHAAVMSPEITSALLAARTKDGRQIPVEVCITSNLVTLSVKQLQEHPVFTALLPNNHPFCICTDDAGIFDTSVSKEYGLFLEAAPHVTEERLKKLAKEALEMSFCRDKVGIRQMKELIA